MISRICRKIICSLANALTACAMAVEKISKVCFSFAMVLLGIIGSLYAQTPLHDPNLHTASPEALQQLSNERVRQKIIENSQAHYAGRCVCQYMTQDSRQHSCKGRHEVIKTKPLVNPVSPAAIELRRRFPGITDNAKARAHARNIAGWTPLPVQPRQVTRRRPPKDS
jgi:hypothetical protein